MDYLRELDLRNNKIDDINAFANHKLEFLQCLYLSYNDFDPKGWTKFYPLNDTFFISL